MSERKKPPDRAMPDGFADSSGLGDSTNFLPENAQALQRARKPSRTAVTPPASAKRDEKPREKLGETRGNAAFSDLLSPVFRDLLAPAGESSARPAAAGTALPEPYPEPAQSVLPDTLSDTWFDRPAVPAPKRSVEPFSPAPAEPSKRARSAARVAGSVKGSSHKGASPGDTAPHYLGHRERLRERFAAAPDALPDYEILEMVLFRAIARGDVKGLAKALIARFGSLAEVIHAPVAQLAEVKGVGPAILHDLKLLETVGQRLALGAVDKREVLGSWSAVLTYCRTAMAFAEREEFRVLFLDKRNGLLGDEVMQRGTVDHTPVYPREVMKRALQRNASALILVHNHPSGDTTPSRLDLEMTREIVALAGPLGIVIHDHLIIGREGHASFRALGLL